MVEMKKDTVKLTSLLKRHGFTSRDKLNHLKPKSQNLVDIFV